MHHGIGALPLLLRQRHDGRVVGARICPVARADIPVVVHLIRDIELVYSRFETLALNPVVGLGHQCESFRNRQFDRAAMVFRIRDGRQTRRRKSRVDFLHVEGNLTVFQWQKITDSNADIRPIRARIGAREGRVVVTVEFEAAVVRKSRRGHEPCSLRDLQLQPGLRADPQHDVGSAETAVAIVLLVGVRRQTDPKMIAGPVMGLGAHGQRIYLLEARRIFVADHQVSLIAGQRAASNQEIVGSRRCKRLGKHYAALNVVDVVVEHGPQIEHAGHDARCSVANLDSHAFGSDRNVLPLQKVQRSARAPKLFPARDRSGFGREDVKCKPLLTEARRRLRLNMQVAAVQATVHLRQLIVHVSCLEITPHAVVLILAQTDEELAGGRRHFLHRAVIAEGGIVVIRVDSPEHRSGRLVHEITEQILQRPLLRVRACRQSPVIAELAVDEERQPAIQ